MPISDGRAARSRREYGRASALLGEPGVSFTRRLLQPPNHVHHEQEAGCRMDRSRRAGARGVRTGREVDEATPGSRGSDRPFVGYGRGDLLLLRCLVVVRTVGVERSTTSQEGGVSWVGCGMGAAEWRPRGPR